MTTSTSWNRLRSLVKKRDNSICYHCKKDTPDGHCDHLIPLSKGGTDSIDNLVWSCKDCNLSKGGRSPITVKVIAREMQKDFIKPNFSYLWEELTILLIKLIIPPYPSIHRFTCREYQWDKILEMRKYPITTWIRERIWPITSDVLEAMDYVRGVEWHKKQGLL